MEGTWLLYSLVPLQVNTEILEESTLNCIKQIILTGYRVRYADLRQPKPRPILEAVHVLDREYVDALNLMGINPADFIEERFTRGGYHVLTVERLPKRRTVVDLLQLWEGVADPNSPEGGASHAEA